MVLQQVGYSLGSILLLKLQVIHKSYIFPIRACIHNCGRDWAAPLRMWTNELMDALFSYFGNERERERLIWASKTLDNDDIRTAISVCEIVIVHSRKIVISISIITSWELDLRHDVHHVFLVVIFAVCRSRYSPLGGWNSFRLVWHTIAE